MEDGDLAALAGGAQALGEAGQQDGAPLLALGAVDRRDPHTLFGGLAGARVELGAILRGFELYGGYDYFAIGDVTFHGPLAGLRFWL